MKQEYDWAKNSHKFIITDKDVCDAEPGSAIDIFIKLGNMIGECGNLPLYSADRYAIRDVGFKKKEPGDGMPDKWLFMM